jgi:hypothetical protein
MRVSNAEWDFMGRTFLVLALANMSYLEPEERGEYLRVMDRIIEETIRLESERGMLHFLMPYAAYGPFVGKPARSLFVDGEIAMMLAARQFVEVKEEFRQPLSERVASIVDRLEGSRAMLLESYPDECWIFDHAVALAAVRMSDALEGEDHRALCDAWVANAKAKLVDPTSGLLISSANADALHGDGPEGSTLWMAAHCLSVVDDGFALQQYNGAKRLLAKRLFGFAWAREWPVTWMGSDDVDSGPTVPVLEVNAGSSGLALVGAAAFGDHAYLRELITTLNFAAFPIRDGDRLRYGASNQVGDAVLLYALVQGPLWDDVKARLSRG